MKNLGVALFVMFLGLSFGCKKETQQEIDEALIVEYIEDNMLDAEATGSGLYIVIDEPGNDEHPDLSSDVTIIYRGTLLNGVEFDSSDGDAVEFPLNQLIDGWQEGIPYFGKGGSGLLLIPSHLGYGSFQAGIIPPNSVIVFEIELVDFN